MKFSYGLPIVLLGAAVVMVQSQVAVGLTPAEVNAIAKQITVRIDGANTGSGVIINRQGNTYTVLTNEHVVRLKGNYTLQTPDNRRYSFNQSVVKYFPGVDLAVLQFTSTENYRKPELGNSGQVSEGTTIYVTGWADPDAVSPERSYTFLPGGISRIVRNAKNGYAWVHTNPTKPGMSGGPVLDGQGRLVGVNGLSLTNPGTGATDFFGIPINTYLTLAAKQGGNQQATKPSSPPSRKKTAVTSPPATTSPHLNTNSTAANFVLANSVIADSSNNEFFYGVNSVAISPDGRTLASGSWDDTIKIWNLATGQLIRTLAGHSYSVNSVAISADGRTLASGSFDKTIKIWNLATGQLIRTLGGHSEWVRSVAISPDGRTLVSGSGDKTIKIWRLSER
ncbi:trypsin-like peptidase domain-containing protein [Brasilonema octagenarum]|uniref:Serine/threonine protein kinase n=1 Tax=Brasilonema octagenarum UFV-OR1 TaxID=417115 RepID=A0ABX1MFS0_9CYAN|nr:trypsin-like peptidase domain-containing protein [Brasilonema octagenarum]NMF65714.1 serine/threonine protein kinase [Brasilonema octagenarum UFV-OR1]